MSAFLWYVLFISENWLLFNDTFLDFFYFLIEIEEKNGRSYHFIYNQGWHEFDQLF
jgi:hypothetical protein